MDTDDVFGCYTSDSIITGYNWPQCDSLATTATPSWAWWWGGSATALAVLLLAALVVVLLVARRTGDAD